MRLAPRNTHRLVALTRRKFSAAQRAARSTTADPTEPFRHRLGPGMLAAEGEPVTRALYDRLDEQDVAEVLARMRASEAFKGSGLDPEEPRLHRWLILSWGVWLGVDAVTAKTGLVAEMPPDEVHAMARGPLAAAGGVYEADLVVNALESVGVTPRAGASALDFGCSSGRVVRVLRAAYPDLRWIGCDPNERAIEWATRWLPGIEFFVSPHEPPLDREPASLDFVYAISIWSHFGEELGMRWFDEMHRLIVPGGYLVATAHGLGSIAYYAAQGVRSETQLHEIRRALCTDGFWYAPEFGVRGDSGVVNPEWGTSFLSTEWVLTRLCPRWRVVEFAPGRNQSNQDVYVLQRV